MSEYRGVFSNDGLWWWTGTAWMPARPPDGRSARWTGTQWAAGGGSLSVWALIGIGLGLGFAEFVWAFLVFFITTSEVNALWEARGRVGYEDITDWPGSVPLLMTLLIIPIIVAILSSASLKRYWWIGVLCLAGWPAMAFAVDAFFTPGDQTGSIAAAGVFILALLTIGLIVNRIAWRRWRLSADGLRWVRGGRSFPTTSTDGRWRWDGQTWQPVPGPGGELSRALEEVQAVPEAQDREPKPTGA